LFLGPTDIGKTELAKALASSLFDDDEARTSPNSAFSASHVPPRPRRELGLLRAKPCALGTKQLETSRPAARTSRSEPLSRRRARRVRAAGGAAVFEGAECAGRYTRFESSLVA
tara:strand:+ start:248 stop:589 length:342 start_codon:yes stop_codon:yes gene_type:complete